MDLKNKISKILFSIPVIKEIMKWRSNYIDRNLAFQDPRINANRVFRTVFKRDIDWDNPKNLIEKIYWLELFSDISLWSICADKFRIREYVEKKGLSFLMPQLYGHWDKASDINFELLPKSFVLKTTNGCGQVYLVKDKCRLDIRSIKKKLNEWMKLKFGYTDGQIHYSKIKPTIIAEEYLSSRNDVKNYSSSDSDLKDYKVWCFKGVPECILVAYDREIGIGEYKLSMFDVDWKNISDIALNKEGKHYSGLDIEKPEKLEDMLRYASILSEDFMEVRIDFYEVDGKIYLGEMTFSSGYGSYNNDFYDYLGSKINLNNVQRIVGINKPID